MVGDHGISLIEDGGVTPYDNPHVSNFHVPLVFAHPKLPPINIDSRVTSMQIVPTIMDLLKESGSLGQDQAKAIQDILPLYEGQSMIRETIASQGNKRDWQFTVMNTGWSFLLIYNLQYLVYLLSFRCYLAGGSISRQALPARRSLGS
jgi:arylsulfatase A-like enzyme